MKKFASLGRMAAVPIAVALTVLGIGSAAQASKNEGKTDAKVKAKEITCEEFLALGTEVQPRVVYWLEGFTQAGDVDGAEIDVDGIERPVEMIVTDCHQTPKASLLEKLKSYL